MSLPIDFLVLLFALLLVFDHHIVAEREITFYCFEALRRNSHLVVFILSETFEADRYLVGFVVEAVAGIVVLCCLRDRPAREEEVLIVSYLNLLLVHRARL